MIFTLLYSIAWISESEFLSVCFKGGVKMHHVSNDPDETNLNLKLSEYGNIIHGNLLPGKHLLFGFDTGNIVVLNKHDAVVL